MSFVEWLLLLQPACGLFAFIMVLMLAACCVGAGASYETGHRKLGKRLIAGAVSIFITLVPVVIVATIDNGLKNVYVYKVATSDTTEKAVNTLEKALEVLDVKLEEAINNK